MDYPRCQLIYAVVVVPEFRVIAFSRVVHDESRIVADHLYLGVPDGRETVGDDRQAGDAEGAAGCLIR